MHVIFYSDLMSTSLNQIWFCYLGDVLGEYCSIIFGWLFTFCPQKWWITLCNRAGGGSTGRRQTGATAQSTSALTLERSSIFYQTWKWLDLLKLARAFKIVQSSSAAGMPLAIRASNSTSMRRWVSNTWNRTENYLERLFLRYHSKSYVRQRGVGGGAAFTPGHKE